MRAALAAILALFCVPLLGADLAVSLAGGTPPDFSNQLSDSNLLVARFELEATGGDVQVDDITVHFTGETLADETFSAVRVYFDANGNGTLEGGEQVDTDATPNGTDDFLTFSGPFTVNSGLIRDIDVQVDIANDPTSYGEEFEFRIDAAASITLNSGTDTVSGAFPVTANTLTIRHSENEIVPGGGNPSGTRDVYYGADERAALHFIVSSLTATQPGQLSGIDLNSITITVTVGNSAQTDVIDRVSLWQDDGDSSFEPGSGEVLIQDRTPADVGNWTVAGSIIDVTFSGSAIQLLSDIPAGGSKTLWVGIDVGSEDAVCEVSVSRTNIVGALGVDADYFVPTTTSVNGGVLNIMEKPEKSEPLEPPGEGGCSTGGGAESELFMLILGLLALAAVVRAFVCRLRAANYTR